jgi:hypothetical protein
MKKAGLVLVVFLVFGLVSQAMAVDFSLHGDMNNRFMLYSNHVDFLRPEQQGTLDDGTVDDNFGEIKYRFWFDATSDDGAVKGVFATEIGGLRFGDAEGMPYSGDKVKMEVRWAYLDFQLPFVDQKSRLSMGLQPFTVNEYIWQETVGGVKFYGDVGDMNYEAAWARGYEVRTTGNDDDREDVDALFGRFNFKPAEGLKLGVFALYQMSDADADNPADFGSISSRDWLIKRFEDKVDLDLWTLGLDGGFSPNPFFIKWDLMYQNGNIDNINYTDFASGLGRAGDFTVNAYFAHLDAGITFGNHKLTYTFWYASGDDDPLDSSFKGFLATDLDRTDSITIMQGGYTDDTYFTERPYIHDKGFVMNKIALDSKVTDKLTVGGALMYMMTAEDIEYTDNQGRLQKDDKIGIELNGYLKYLLYQNVEFAVNAGYLWADDAMDFFEVDDIRDGSSDEDIFISTARVRYMF